MKNIKSTNKARTTNSNEGYGLGSSKEGWDNITSEGDGYASKCKPLTAWAVEVDGEICTRDIFPNRLWARIIRKDYMHLSGAKASVRKVLITPIAGR